LLGNIYRDKELVYVILIRIHVFKSRIKKKNRSLNPSLSLLYIYIYIYIYIKVPNALLKDSRLNRRRRILRSVESLAASSGRVCESTVAFEFSIDSIF
jgi:hypothetical protein